MTNLNRLNEERVVLENAIKELEVRLEIVKANIKKEESQKGNNHNEFIVGAEYTVFMRSTDNRIFKCTAVENGKIKGIYNNGTEKTYKVKPIWDSIKAEKEGQQPTAYGFIVDNRTKTLVTSDYIIK